MFCTGQNCRWLDAGDEWRACLGQEFTQLWEHRFSPDMQRIAAIVATESENGQLPLTGCRGEELLAMQF